MVKRVRALAELRIRCGPPSAGIALAFAGLARRSRVMTYLVLNCLAMTGFASPVRAADGVENGFDSETPVAWRVPTWSVVRDESSEFRSFVEEGSLESRAGEGKLLCFSETPDAFHQGSDLHHVGRFIGSETSEEWSLALPDSVVVSGGLIFRSRPILLLEDSRGVRRVSRTLVQMMEQPTDQADDAKKADCADTLATQVRSVRPLGSNLWRVTYDSPRMQSEVWTGEARIPLRNADTVSAGVSTWFRAFSNDGAVQIEELSRSGESLRTQETSVSGVVIDLQVDSFGAVWRERKNLSDLPSTRLHTMAWGEPVRSVSIAAACRPVGLSANWILIANAVGGAPEKQPWIAYTIRNRDELTQTRTVAGSKGFLGEPLLWRDSLLVFVADDGGGTPQLAELALDGSFRASFREADEPPRELRVEGNWLFVRLPRHRWLGFDLRLLETSM